MTSLIAIIFQSITFQHGIRHKPPGNPERLAENTCDPPQNVRPHIRRHDLLPVIKRMPPEGRCSSSDSDCQECDTSFAAKAGSFSRSFHSNPPHCTHWKCATPRYCRNPDNVLPAYRPESGVFPVRRAVRTGIRPAAELSLSALKIHPQHIRILLAIHAGCTAVDVAMQTFMP